MNTRTKLEKLYAILLDTEKQVKELGLTKDELYIEHLHIDDAKSYTNSLIKALVPKVEFEFDFWGNCLNFIRVKNITNEAVVIVAIGI